MSHAFALAPHLEHFVPLEGLPLSAQITVVMHPGPERLWPMIRRAGDRNSFTAHDIAANFGCSVEHIENYLVRLKSAGMAAEAGLTTSRRKLWALTSKRVAPPFVDKRGEVPHGHEVATRIWRALRMGKAMSFTALMAALADETFDVPRETARTYVAALARCGYLAITEAERECGEHLYRLIPSMNRGPLPPRLLRAQLVYDPNEKAFAGHTVTAEEVRL